MKCLDVYCNYVPSKLNSIQIVVDELISNLQNSYGELSESILFELKVILNEALINAIRHGNGEDEKKLVKIKAGLSVHDVMFIIIEDEGCGYNFIDVCSSTKAYKCSSELPEMSESGRGIMIVRSLCDKVKVNAKGNKIVIVKRISRLQPATEHH